MDSAKAGYEQRLMEVEERLTLEQKRCETVIKTRVAVLEEKLLKSKNKEAEINMKLKEAVFQKESNEKEIKILRDKSREQQQEMTKLATQHSQKLKLLEDAERALRLQTESQSRDL